MVLISVIMPNYNHSEYISAALEAILNQSEKSFEIQLVDDCSTDNSLEVIAKYTEKYPQIKLTKLSKNGGPVNAMNIALQKAQGEYLAFCSADDAILPGFFDESVKMLQKYPQAGLCTSNFCYFYHEKPDEFFEKYHPKLSQEGYFSPAEVKKMIKKYNFWLPGLTSIVRREDALKAGHMLHDLNSICDWFMMLTIGFRKGVCFIPKPLTTCRMTNQSYCVKDKQYLVYPKMRDYLQSPAFIDVKNYFLSSGIFYQLNKEIFPFMLKTKGYARYFPQVFLQKLRQKRHKKKYIRAFKKGEHCAL